MTALLAALGLAVALAGEPANEHAAPAPSLAGPARVVEADRQNALAEMWQRGILAADTERWSSVEMDLLRRVRAAEAAGAIDLLKRRLRGALKGLAVSFKPAGAQIPRLRLTREGYDKWLFLRSQDALELFEKKGVDTGLVFLLTDLDGGALFDPNGLLTPIGEEIYRRALLNIETHWKTPNGEIFGNRPRAGAAPAPESFSGAAPFSTPRSATPGAPPVTGSAVKK